MKQGEINYCENYHHDGRGPVEAFAFIQLGRPLEKGFLCKFHLDEGLDAADSGFMDEPVLLSFL